MNFKSSLLTVILFTSSYVAQSQELIKGSTLVSGGVSFSDYHHQRDYSNSISTTENSSGFVNIAGARAISDNLFLGLSLSYGHTRSYSKIEGYTNSGKANIINAYFGSIFLKKYVNLGNKFYGYVQPSVGYNYNKDSSSIAHNFNLSLSPGVSYNIYRKLFIDLSLPEFASVYYTPKDDRHPYEKGRGFSFYSGLNPKILNNLSVGFSFIF